MENDRDANYSDNMNTSGKPYEDLTGSAGTGQNLSFFKDDESKAWERKLLAPDMGLDAAALQMSKETRSFLWKAGTVPYVSAVQLTHVHPENPSAEAAREDSSFNETSSSSTFTGSFARTSSISNRSGSRSSRPSASHASNRTSRRSAAWDILSGSGPTSYADTANSGSRSGREGRRTRFVQKTGTKHAGASSGPKKATSTYETVRKTMQAKPALRRKSLFLVLFLTIAVSILITAGTYIFIRKSMPGSDSIPPEIPVFIGGDEDGKENTGSDVLTDFGDDFSDFYTPKCIVSCKLPGDNSQYKEVCVIDPKFLFGTAGQPADERYKLFYSSVYPAWITLGYMNTDSYQDCGYTVMYADPETANPYGMPDILLPPQLADQGQFFEAVIRGFIDPDPDYKDNYSDCRIGKIQTAAIGNHRVTYLTVTFKDSVGREILDVYSFEQKPLGTAFIAECRCENGEVRDGEEALSDLYEMLSFHTEDFEAIDASSHLFTKTRVYSGDNSYTAAFDVSDLGDLIYSRNFYRNLAAFGIGENDSTGDPLLQIDLNYSAYSSVEDIGGYEQWIDYALEDEKERGNYITPPEETGRAWFTFDDCTVYFLSMAGSEKLSRTTEDTALFMYRIETPDGEVTLDLRFEHAIPENWDPEEFLKEHISLEAIK